MNFYLTKFFRKKALKLCRKDPLLKNELSKQFSLFQQNHFHPSLRLHKLKGKRSEQFTIWIAGDIRALSIKDGDSYVFFDLISHDDY